MKIYYQVMLLLGCVVAIYAFLVPVLISMPSDITVIAGFGIALGAIPLFIIWSIKIIKQISK
jgi:hypothetical protein